MTEPALNKKQVIAVCHYVGFRGLRLVKAGATSGAESAWQYESTYVNANGSVDRGLFQINSSHSDYLSDTAAFKPILNAAFAYRLSKEGKDWSPWYAYGGARYLLYYPLVAASLLAAKAGLWKQSLEEREAVFARAGDDWVPTGG